MQNNLSDMSDHDLIETFITYVCLYGINYHVYYDFKSKEFDQYGYDKLVNEVNKFRDELERRLKNSDD